MTHSPALTLARDALQVAVDSDYGALWNHPSTAKPTALARCIEALAAIDAELAASADAGKLADMEARKDAAYLERNQVVAALAKCFPSGVARTVIEGWSEDWHGCVYIDLPTGQASWHFHDSQAYLFDGLPAYTGSWDGHDTPEKYRRLAALATQAAPAERTFCNGSTKFDEGRSEDWKNGWWAGNMEGRSQAVLDTAAQLSAAIRYGDARVAAAHAAPAVTHKLVSDKEYLRLFEEARLGSDKPAGTLRGIRACIAAYEDAAPAVTVQAGELDPNESDAATLWAEIWRLRAAVKGPVGFASWQDAAVDERIRRVKAERALAATPAAETSAQASAWQPLTEGEREQAVSAICEYGTGFVAPLFAVIEGVERKLMERNTRAQASSAAGVQETTAGASLNAQAAPERCPHCGILYGYHKDGCVALAAQAPVIPAAGWRLVPVEATLDMVLAGSKTPGMAAIDASSGIMQARGYPLDPAAFEDGSALQQAWRAMLAAAPASTSASTATQLAQLLREARDYLDVANLVVRGVPGRQLGQVEAEEDIRQLRVRINGAIATLATDEGAAHG